MPRQEYEVYTLYSSKGLQEMLNQIGSWPDWQVHTVAAAGTPADGIRYTIIAERGGHK